MLGKLIKYEFLATGRQLLPAYGGVLLFAVLSRIVIEIMGGFAFFAEGLVTPLLGAVFAIMMIFYGLSICGALVLTVVLIVRRFYLNLFRDEGYLTNTLPVSVDGHIWGKLIPATCWSIVGLLVTIASVAIVFGGLIAGAIAAYGPPVDWTYFWNDVFAGVPMLLLVLLNGLVSTMAGILAFYSALSIGQLVNRHKILLAIGAYLGMSFIFSMVISIFSVVFAFGFFNYSFDVYTDIRVMEGIMYAGMLGVSLIQGIIHYVIARYIMKNKLNLE